MGSKLHCHEKWSSLCSNESLYQAELKNIFVVDDIIIDDVIEVKQGQTIEGGIFSVKIGLK